MIHFTYSDNPNKENLCQGDVLKITPELKSVLQNNHSYFTGEQYKYFIVITQTCDLFRRNGKCNSNYITLAAVRSYEDFLIREAKQYGCIEKDGSFFFPQNKVDNFIMQIERLYNNNEKEFFFLAEDRESDFNENMVAYLKVSFPIKTSLHYDTCLKAKKLELTDTFKAKLGWLVGQMYSRVGTKDWYELMEEKDFKKKLKEDIRDKFIVCEKKKLEPLFESIDSGSINLSSRKEIEDFISKLSIKSKYDLSVDYLEILIQSSKCPIEPDNKKQLIAEIKSKKKLKTIILS